MDKFFKLVNSDIDPTCPEANEYLAEDRVMCLQIYIKENNGYYLTFVPDAKAFTDAPQNLSILIKQRRRWMNGALFGALRVLNNFYYMVECKKTKHGFLAQFGMFVYMVYFLTMQLLSFLMVGSLYVSIKLFYTNFFESITSNKNFQNKHPWIFNFFNA